MDEVGRGRGRGEEQRREWRCLRVGEVGRERKGGRGEVCVSNGGGLWEGNNVLRV